MPDANKKPENPEAFAFGFGTNSYSDIQKGMTLRDYFAAKAMQAMISRDDPSAGFSKDTAEQIYYIADEMLKQRAK